MNISSSHDFPAFYCAKTYNKIKSPLKVDNPKDAAHIISMHKKLRMNTGMLFTVPIPDDHSLNPKEVELKIIDSLKKAKSLNIIGKDVTPFLLKELNENADGKFLEASKFLNK